MNKRKISSILNLVLTFSMVFAMISPAMAAPAMTDPPPPPLKEEEHENPGLSEFSGGPTVDAPPAPEVKVPEWQAPALTPEEALLKIHSDLRELAQTASVTLPSEAGLTAAGEQDATLIQVVAAEGTDLSAYFVDGNVFARPSMGKGAGATQAFIGFVYPSNLLKIAHLAQVEIIFPITLERTNAPEPYPADDPVELPERGADDWAMLQADADKLREGSLPWDQARAFGDGREDYIPTDWFEVDSEGPHKAEAAWERGYTGEGVTVAVLDDGIDPAHPDLMGTQKIYSSTVASQYNGWPMVFSPFSQFLYFMDEAYGYSYIANGYYSAHYVDTSETPALTPCGTGLSCFDYTPLIDVGVSGYPHTYVIDNAMTQSGVVHVGTHPDFDLRDWIWGERPAVLVADPNTPGVYDTIYVDLDDDYDFRDEKPLTRADVNDSSTYNDMISYRDMDGDGLADISGGMVYFIADGVNVFPASDYMWGAACPGFMCPGNGDMVALSGSTFDRSYSHGTQCASNVVGQGISDGMLPEFGDLGGAPDAAVYGMAPDAKMVNISDIYYNFDGSKVDAYLFAALGYDGIDQTGWDMNSGTGGHTDTDAIQITSNSYGSSDEDNDGWEYDGQLVSQIQREYAPNLQFLFSTGNGAPAYGTVAPPSPDTAIAVGASTQFGSTGWDSITDTHQIMNNDVTPFSNRGPGARGTHGTDVVAGGAFAAGAEELNYYSTMTWGAPDGNLSWVSWGGTSRSAPVAMGVLALIYDAYYQANGVWPTYDEAEALLMASATDLNYDVFSQGGGSVNADIGTAVAGGEYGLYAMPAAWQPGDYNGDDYPGFAHIVYPGDTWNQTITVENPGIEPITATISDVELLLIDSVEFDYTVTAAQVADEEDNFYKAFNYFIPITATAGMDASWYNIDVPPDADLMIVRQMFPYDQFDDDGDYSWDNRFYLMVYNWQDEDGDGIVWDDKDANGVVDFVNDTEITLIDYGSELVWDDPITELDRWEYGRFSYNRPTGNRNEMWVHDPLDRMIDGLFIGLRHHPGSSYTGDTTLSYRIDFYSEQDVDWLSTDVAILAVPAGGSATFQATADVPADIPTGIYQAAIQIYDSGWMTYTESTTVIPVAMSVAEDFSDGMTLGGYDTYAYDADRPYNNAAVRGLFDWGWRAESGDWRFFFTDLKNCDIVSLYEEDFESDDGGYTSGGTNSSWAYGAPTSGPGAAHSGVNVWATNLAGDYNASEDSYIELEIDLSAYAGQGTILDWWEYADVESGWDSWYADVSNDGGATWARLQWWTGATGVYWNPQFNLDSSYAVSNFRIRFGLISDSSFNEAGLYVDDITIQTTICDYPVDTKFLIRDQWDDAGPHTDIDTILLGPTPTSMGSGWYDWADSSYYGPYTLDTVAKSPNMNIGGGTWMFDTSSGTNEDWITAPFPDWTADRGGLHEVLQHNVLFEGDQFDVVFTKTLGTLWEDIHSFAIETYVDAGTVGTVTLEAGLDLNGLVAESVLFEVAHESWDEEPLPFIDDNTIEWVYPFSVTDTIDIDLWTSSSDISDIDLYLFHWNGSAWAQMGSSTTGTSDEAIYIANPADGDWMIGVLNWSGPAGHFDLDLVIRSQIGELEVTGTSTTPVAAGTPVPLVISYDYPMTPGYCYEGLVFVGPPEAPYLKEIEVEICRLTESAMLMKEVDYETAFPGNELHYTIDLFNLSNPGAYFEFTDPIPAGTEFVTVTNATYDPLLDQVVYTGTLPLGGSPPNAEGFEDGVVPPVGWTQQIQNASYTWDISGAYAHSGSYSAYVPWDYAQDEWLLSPYISDLTGGETTSLWSEGSYYWGVDPYDNYDMNVWLVVDSVGGSDDVFLGNVQDDWSTTSWTWVQSTFTLPITLPAGDLRIGYQFIGDDDADGAIDDIVLPGTLALLPSQTVEVTVRVTDTVAAGDYITNTAMLQATHYLPQEMQVEPVVDASAYTHIGAEDFATSYKDAPDSVLPEGEIYYEIHVINTGDKLVENVVLTDPIPANTTYAWHNPGVGSQTFDYNGTLDQMEWTGNIAPGEEWIFGYAVTAELPGTIIENVATIAWDGNEFQMLAQTEVLGYGVDISPATAALSGAPSDVMTYTLTVTNTGDVLDIFDLTAAAGYTWPVTIVPTSTGLLPNESMNVSVLVTIPADAADADFDVVTITATSQGDITKTDSAVLTTTAVIAPVYGVELSGDAAMSGEPGDVMTYTLTVTNTGNVADTYTIAIIDTWSATALADIMLNTGATGTFDVVVTVPAGAADGDFDVAAVSVTSVNDALATDNADLTTTADVPEYIIYLPIVSTIPVFSR